MGEVSVPKFFENLMAHVMQGAMIPKVQIERSLGPILGFFIEDVITKHAVCAGPSGSGNVITLCPEFPIKKQDSNQSTNVDWLMYDLQANALIFLELKTTDTTFDEDQAQIYVELRQKIHAQGASFLITDLELISQNSAEKGKYRQIKKWIEALTRQHRIDLAECRKTKIVYLVPDSLLTRAANKKYFDGQQSVDVVTLGELSKIVPDAYADEWRVLAKHLDYLDQDSLKRRNDRA